MVWARALGKWSGLAGLVAVVLLVSGCSGPAASRTASEYVEPAWMAKYRADRDEALPTTRNV